MSEILANRRLVLPIKRRRDAIIWASLSFYCVSVVGFSLPQRPEVSKASSEPFPCQHHACGCQTAEQCRQHCCCFTDAEKEAWYRSRGLQSHTSDKVASKTATPKAGSCCSGKRCRSSEPQSDSQDAPWHSHVASQKCRGLTSLWVLVGVALPLQMVVSDNLELPSYFICIGNDRRISMMLPPPVPPPRLT